MNSIVTIKTEPASLTVNYEAARKRLEKELSKYDVVVTVDTVGEAKKLATEMNKIAGDIDQMRKDAVAAVSAPIKEFDEKMKSLVTMCKDGRTKLSSQIQTFEDETRATIRESLEQLIVETWSQKQVREEFRKARVDDLVILSHITATGKLTAKAINLVRDRVNVDFNTQAMVDMRLRELENKSFRAGLSAPLERVHVESFLFASDDEYNDALVSLLQVEVARQHKARELEAKREQINSVPDTQQPTDEPTKVEKPKPEPVKSTPPQGKVTRIVTATFEVAVAPNIADKRITERLRAMIESAGITSLTNIEVQ